MNVILHQKYSNVANKSFTYCRDIDTLQVQVDLLNQLQSTRNRGIPNFKFYCDEMEKIHNGDTGVQEASIKLDEFLGSLGIPNDNNILKKGPKYGIC